MSKNSDQKMAGIILYKEYKHLQTKYTPFVYENFGSVVPPLSFAKDQTYSVIFMKKSLMNHYKIILRTDFF